MPAEQIFKDQTSIRIVLIYIVIGCVWIILSDRAVEWIDGGTGRMTLFQTYKGWFYVVATGLILYLLIHRSVNQIKNSESEKQKTGMRYSELVENANDIVYSLDAEGKFTSINRAGEDILGYKRSELLAKNLAEIVAPENQKYVKRLLGKNSQGNRSVHEIELLKKDGTGILLEINTSPIYLNDDLVEMQGIARDLTARRAAEIKLRESETRNRELIETTNEGVIITDEQGVIKFVNERMSEMLDYDPAEILDNYAFDFMDDDAQHEARKKLEARRAGVKEVFDFKFRTFDGNDLWTIVSSTPLFEDGKYTGSIAMITDITERKHAEELLKNEQKINNATLASLPGIFYFYDETGKFLRWNQNFETVSGFSAEEIAGMHPLDFFSAEDQEMLQNKIDKVFEDGETCVEADFISKNKSRKSYFFTGKRLILDDKKYLLGVGVDMSDCQSARNFDPE